jgi:putative DNA primase/helicase
MTAEIVAFPVATPDHESLAWKELNDLGNAERLVARYDGKLCFVDGMGWVAWTGTHWSAEEGQAIATRAAHEVARSMKDEFKALRDQIKEERLRKGVSADMASKRLADLFQWAKTSGNANKTAAMLAQAQCLVSRRRDTFDADPLAFNCLNGTLRAVKGQDGRWRAEFAPHEPNDWISKVAAVGYDPAAACPQWDSHLATVLPSAEVRRFFQMGVGYSMTGLTVEQVMFLLQGRGGDGKSTTMDVIRQLFGGYGVSADVQTFMAGSQRSGADASPDLARLAGDVRLCSTGEPKRGGALDEAKIKAITGGSPIAARELHGDLFEYLPHFALWLECNAKPRISGDDDGIWRRVMVILFPHQFKGDEVDKRVKERLIEEGPGILNWMVEGMLMWLDAGRLDPPEEVIQAVEDYRRSASPFGEWLIERVDTSDPRAMTLASALHGDFKKWCDEQGVADRDVMNVTAFGRALGDRQIGRRKDSKGRIMRVGASLRDGYAWPPASSTETGGGASAGEPDARPFAPIDDGELEP